jgi:hypothetical protein
MLFMIPVILSQRLFDPITKCPHRNIKTKNTLSGIFASPKEITG